MRVVCSYCKKEMGKKEPFSDETVSHTICPDCFHYFEEQVDGLPLDRYLDKFDAPILIVDSQARVVAANKMAEDVTGKTGRESFGLLGGEVMECAYARLPEGCGKTVHCEACTIRNTVMAAMESGEPQMHVPVKLKQADREVEMTISTDKIDGLVRIVIESVD